MKLAPAAEEVATFFGKMLDHDYTTKEVFRKNFFKDWRKVGMRTAEYVEVSSNKYFQRSFILGIIQDQFLRMQSCAGPHRKCLLRKKAKSQI